LGKSENVPILGWLYLKGRCRWCKAPISPRYPLVEAATALLFLLVFARFGWSWDLLGYCLFLSWLLALSLIDFDTMTLPDSLTRFGLLSGLVFQAISGWYFKGWQGALTYLGWSILGAVLGIWLLDLVRTLGSLVFNKEAMGGGDPKLLAGIGAWLGWQAVLVALFLACLTGAIFGIAKVGKQQPFPFGPFLGIGGALSLFFGERIISMYSQLFS
jgi:leader peptidase (prepilin peptidase)/N-methyltransferase